MDALSLSCISKALIHGVPASSSSHERRTSRLHRMISCRVTKVSDDNLYKILCLSPKNATMDDIKRAYRSMALRYHPDVCNDPSKKEESTRMFVQLNAAYEALSNPRLRQEYDADDDDDDDDDEIRRHRWQQQLAELKIRRSHHRMREDDAQSGTSTSSYSYSYSWGSRMRAQNMQDFSN